MMSSTLEEICHKLNFTYSGNGDLVVRRVCGMNRLIPGSVVFITKDADLMKISPSDEVVVVVPRGVDSPDHNLIFSDDPLASHVKITCYLHPPLEESGNIHPTAVFGENVVIGKGVTIDAHVVLYKNVRIGEHSVLRAEIGRAHV